MVLWCKIVVLGLKIVALWRKILAFGLIIVDLGLQIVLKKAANVLGLLAIQRNNKPLCSTSDFSQSPSLNYQDSYDASIW